MPEVDPQHITVLNLWLYNVCMTIAMTIIYKLYKSWFILGFEAIKTWKFSSVDKLHERHGKYKTLFATLWFGFGCWMLLHLIALWAFAIMFTFIGGGQ